MACESWNGRSKIYGSPSAFLAVTTSDNAASRWVGMAFVRGRVSNVIGIVEVSFLTSVEPRVTTTIDFPTKYLCPKDLTVSSRWSIFGGYGDLDKKSGDPAREMTEDVGGDSGGNSRRPQSK